MEPDGGLNKLTHNSTILMMMWWRESLLHFVYNLSSLNRSVFPFLKVFSRRGVSPLPLKIGKIVGPCSCVGCMCCTLCTECTDG